MAGLQEYYADLHIHIGRTEEGAAVKISASSNLTFFNIAREASVNKGMDVIGIIDCHSPAVQREIEEYLEQGEMTEQPGGGIRYQQTTVLLGAEVEVKEPGRGAAHLLAYLPDLAAMKQFTAWMSPHMKNVELSSQRLYVPPRRLQQQVEDMGGLLVPAHIFTPHKSVYGSAADRMAELLDIKLLKAVELGLSADTEMASSISELKELSFLSNSDAHSLAKIGREYNRIAMAEPSFQEFRKAVARQEGRRITANYGLNPRLGKYHRTFCSACDTVMDDAELSTHRCPYCGSTKIVRGVMDRIQDISDCSPLQMLEHRPPYYYQVPLEFIPGLGPKLRSRLLQQFGTEMNILHHAEAEALEKTAGREIAAMIRQARQGVLQIASGGGGTYGRVSQTPGEHLL